jgi:uncharacterized protein (DUF3820 family)
MADSLGKLTFGKFKGQDIEDVPNSYLEWIIGEDWFKEKHPALGANIKKELEYRERFDLQIGD